jgi:1-acyl-sn-glycerol-3-phosphate acyltransferase
MWAVATGGLLAAGLIWSWGRSKLPALEYFCLGIMRLYARLYHNVWIRPHTRLPAKGPLLLIANHTCSADPAFLQACIPRAMSFLIAEEYFGIRGLGWLFHYMQCIPVARNGRDITSVRVALRRLQAGRAVCVFPEGSLSGTGRGRMRTAKRGAAYLALKSGVPVYPAFIRGGPQHTHVASAWLVSSRAGIVLGKPVDLSRFCGTRITRPVLEEVGALLTSQIVALDPHGKKPPKPYPPLGENPYDRRRRRARQKALSAV